MEDFFRVSIKTLTFDNELKANAIGFMVYLFVNNSKK